MRGAQKLKRVGVLMKITFFGAVEEVTGSRYLIETDDVKILVDCGLFQGEHELTKHNWDAFPVDPKSIEAIVLTHAHIDHTGYIPVLVKKGFKGKIYCSKATYALCAIMLVDSGHLQEEDAKHMNARGDSEHAPIVPLYTAQDAQDSLPLFHAIEYDTPVNIGKTLQATLIRSGHILGSSFVVLTDGKEKLTFSGDLGRPADLIMKTPPHLKETDYLVLESTYGDRLHEKGDAIEALGNAVNQTVKRGGILVIPCFAVARTQTILYCLYQLKQKKMIPEIPIYLDSPMAIKVTSLLCTFPEEHTLSPALCKDVCAVATYTNTADESKKLDHLTHPAILVAGSGMADGGRVVHHLQHFIADAHNTILFVGFQAKGTTGYELVSGAKHIKIYGTSYPVHADIKTIDMLSAHADYNEVLEWLSSFEKAPKKVFLTHGELESAISLKKKIEDRFGWTVVIPKYKDSFELN
jgi:metallo-beta-lactamase family protein